MGLKEFCFDDLALVIYGDAYLVKVNQCRGVRTSDDRLIDLPEWIFKSKNAIWLTEEDAPISIRADHGDLFKKRLSQERDRMKHAS